MSTHLQEPDPAAVEDAIAHMSDRGLSHGLPLLCGSCNRRMDWARLLRSWGGYAVLQGVSGVAPAAESPNLADRDRWEKARSRGRGQLDPTYPRWTIPCHKRCGARYVVRADRLTDVVIAAATAGRDEVVLGVDL